MLFYAIACAGTEIKYLVDRIAFEATYKHCFCKTEFQSKSDLILTRDNINPLKRCIDWLPFHRIIDFGHFIFRVSYVSLEFIRVAKITNELKYDKFVENKNRSLSHSRWTFSRINANIWTSTCSRANPMRVSTPDGCWWYSIHSGWYTINSIKSTCTALSSIDTLGKSI